MAAMHFTAMYVCIAYNCTTAMLYSAVQCKVNRLLG